MRQLFALWLLAANLWGFLMIGLDKRKAERKKWRIREASFFLLAFLGAAPGIELGMLLFHHKTKKASFHWRIHLAFILWLIAALVYFSRCF